MPVLHNFSFSIYIANIVNSKSSSHGKMAGPAGKIPG
jgi:hypothetical protein